MMAQSGASHGADPVLAKAHHGSVSKEQRALIEDDLKRGRLPCRGRDQQPRARHRHGRGRPGRPDRVAAAAWPAPCSGSAAPATRSARCQPRRAVPQAPRRPRPDRGRGRADARGRDRALRIPTNPLDVLAQQVVAATALDAWDVDELFDAGPPQRAVRHAAAQRLRRHPRPARRPLPLRRVRRAAAADRLGPGHRHAHRPARRPAAGGHQRRHHPRPRPVRRLPRRRRAPAAASASSTRRWSTSRGSATCSRSARPAGGSRTSPTTGCWSPPRPASRAGCRSGRATPSAGPPSWARRSARSPASSARCRRRRPRRRPRDRGLDEYAAAQPGRLPRRAGRGHPHRCPATARWSSSGSATSSATGGWSSTRRTAPRCTRRGRWRSTPGCASATASTARRSPPTTAS